MTQSKGAFDPETITMLREVLDGAIAAIPKELRTASLKTELATIILQKAATGERDPTRLRTEAIVRIVTKHGSAQSHAA